MSTHALLTPAQTAELTALIETGKGPAYIKFQRTPGLNMARFLARDLDEWADAINQPCDDNTAEPEHKRHPGRSHHHQYPTQPKETDHVHIHHHRSTRQ